MLKTAAGMLAMGAMTACRAESAKSQSVANKPASAGKSAANRAAKPTLVLVSHPYFNQSVLTRGMQQAAESVSGVTVRNLDNIYGKNVGVINIAEETRLMHEHQRIVFAFPTHWFNITPMMKAWLNDVWGNVGPDLWRGKEMLLVTTAGGGSSTYGSTGRTGVRLADVFLPMKATAAHCGMTYLPPLAFEAATASRLPEYQQAFIQRLSN